MKQSGPESIHAEFARYFFTTLCRFCAAPLIGKGARDPDKSYVCAICLPRCGDKAQFAIVLPRA